LADNEENIQLGRRENDILVRSGRATVYFAPGRRALPEMARRIPARARGMDQKDRPDGRPVLHGRSAQAMIAQEKRAAAASISCSAAARSSYGHGAELAESHVEPADAYDGDELASRLTPATYAISSRY